MKKLVKASLVAGGFLLLSAPAFADGPFQFYAVSPCRAVDTRLGFGGIVPPATTRTFTIKGVCGVPADAKAAALNLTVTQGNTDGDVRLAPAGVEFPLVSTLNFRANENLANGAIVPLSASTPDLAVLCAMASGATGVHIIFDVTGYFK